MSQKRKNPYRNFQNFYRRFIRTFWFCR